MRIANLLQATDTHARGKPGQVIVGGAGCARSDGVRKDALPPGACRQPENMSVQSERPPLTGDQAQATGRARGGT